MHRKRPTDGKANLLTNGACFGCTIACGRISRMDPGHFSVKDKPQYHGASGGVEYEAAWALGAANGVSDLEALTYANFLCNEHGFDPISFGATSARPWSSTSWESSRRSRSASSYGSDPWRRW